MSNPTGMFEPEIGEELLGVDPCQSLHGLDFHYYSALHQEICAESILKDHPVVLETDGVLSLDLKSSLLEPPSQDGSTDSNSPGPRTRWMRSEASTILPVMSSSSRIPSHLRDLRASA